MNYWTAKIEAYQRSKILRELNNSLCLLDLNQPFYYEALSTLLDSIRWFMTSADSETSSSEYEAFNLGKTYTRFFDQYCILKVQQINNKQKPLISSFLDGEQ